jgi:hypothetical protein
MADRLQELLQQRALIKEHLAWLEGEIAAASGRPLEATRPASPAASPAQPAPSPSPSTPVTAVKIATAPVVTGPRLHDDEDSLIAKLAAEEKSAPVPTKKGCWIFFWVTLLVIGAAAWALLLFFYRE